MSDDAQFNAQRTAFTRHTLIRVTPHTTEEHTEGAALVAALRSIDGVGITRGMLRDLADSTAAGVYVLEIAVNGERICAIPVLDT